MMNINFNKYSDGLVPVIIQDEMTKNVLMLGFMNEDAFAQTERTKRVTFFSRTKNRLWTKGEESGNYLLVKNIKLDCDADTLLIKVQPTGAVCHTGTDTCWAEENKGDIFLQQLEKIIIERKNNPSENSYTSQLLKKGINKVAQKFGEEAVELIIEAKDENNDLFTNEAADVLFHYLILLQAKGFSLNDIVEVLQERHQDKK
jgi:phosphoribosyl-AMP cyclohydrolase / phosphoribosyl-ATP pyrophosphohydrolase